MIIAKEDIKAVLLSNLNIFLKTKNKQYKKVKFKLIGRVPVCIKYKVKGCQTAITLFDSLLA